MVDQKMQNRGVAPFYYVWTVQVGIGSAGRLDLPGWLTLGTFDVTPK